MRAVEFDAELSGGDAMRLPADVADRLPKRGHARALILLEEDREDADWRAAAYERFARDDSAEDAVYDTL